MSPPRRRTLDRWLTLAILALALGLRLFHLDHEDIGLDEAASLDQADRPLADVIAATVEDNYPPLHNLSLHASIALFGDGRFALRLPTVVFSLLAVLAAGALAGALYGRRARLVAMLVLALSPAQVMYAQEARMYAPLILFALVSTWCFVRWMTRPSRTNLALYVLSAAACCYSHYFAAFVLIGHDVAALVWWRYARTHPDERGAAPVSLAQWALGQGLVLALFAPWLASMVARFGRVQTGFWIPRPDLAAVEQTLAQAWPGWWPLALGLVVVAIVAGRERLVARARLAGVLVPRPEAEDAPFTFADPRALATLLAPFLVSVVVPLVLSFVVMPFFLHRYLAGAYTVATVLAVAGVVSLRSRAAQAVVVLAIVALGVPRFVDYYTVDQKHRWSHVANRILGRAQPGDMVVPWPYWSGKPLAANAYAPLPPAVVLDAPRWAVKPTGVAWLLDETHAAKHLWYVFVSDTDPLGAQLLGELTKVRPVVSVSKYPLIDLYELGPLAPLPAANDRPGLPGRTNVRRLPSGSR